MKMLLDESGSSAHTSGTGCRRAGRTAHVAWRISAIGVALIAVVLLIATPAAGHGLVQRADPGPGETVSGPLEAVRVRFIDPVASSSVELLDGAGTVLASTTGSGREVVLVPPPVLERPGTYEVRYRFQAGDGHVERGAHTFELVADEDAAVTSWILAGVGVLVAALALGIRRRRRTARRTATTPDHAA